MANEKSILNAKENKMIKKISTIFFPVFPVFLSGEELQNAFVKLK